MLHEKVEQALNDQLNYEIYSAYVYYAMAAYLESIDLPGFANWMQIQVREELTHADRFFRFIMERDGRVRLAAVQEPAFEWDSPLDAFQTAYEHECGVSERIHRLVDLSREHRDHAVEHFLAWFVNEQVEEEASTKAIVQQLKRMGDDGHSLFFVDRELGQRTFVAEAEGTAG
jgi:ferritin